MQLEKLDDRIVPSSTAVVVAAANPIPVSAVSIGSATSGRVVSETNGVSEYGVGSWIKVVSHDNATQETVTTITSYSGGVQVLDTDLITKSSSTGVTTDDHTITTTTSSGSQTVFHDYTYTPAASGAIDIAEVFTDAKGLVTRYIGKETTTNTNYGSETEKTLTNGLGQTETETIEHFSSGDATASETTGINFKGQAFTSATLKTYTGVAQTNALDTSSDGPGSYTLSEIKPVSGQVVLQLDKSFADGKTLDTTKITATVGASTTAVDVISDEKGANDKVSSSTSDETVTSGMGTSLAVGTFTQTGGQNGTEAATSTKTNFGSKGESLENDSKGEVKAIASDVLTIGEARFQVSTGTDFHDRAVNLASLTTGISV